MVNRRAAHRRPFLAGARLRVGEVELEALVHDLNEFGCRVSVSHPLECDSILHLSVGIAGAEEPVGVQVSVAWVKPLTLSSSFQAGLRFLEFDKPQHFQLLSFTLDKERVKQESFELTRPALPQSGSLTEMSPLEVRRLAFLAELSRHLNRSHDVVEVAHIAASSMAEIMRAERVLIMLDRGGTEPEVLAHWGIEPNRSCDGTELTFPYSCFVVRKVLSEGQAVLSFDVANDQALNTVSSLDFLGTRSILCVPLRGQRNVFGVVYMDNSMERAAFSESDREIASILCELAASAIERGQYFSKLVQAEKMGALGTLTASLAHELNNPLTVISGIGELLKFEPIDQTLVDDLESMTQRCLELVKDITNWSRVEDSPAESVRLEDVVETTLRLVRSELARLNVRLNVKLDGPLPSVRGHARQLSQVLVNLITNACQALTGNESGVISILGSTKDNLVYLSVQDNGPGIPSQYLTRIFDPFFTTKAKEKGTGLGLSISRDILSRYGGSLEVRNLSAGGAQFQICLPVGRKSRPYPSSLSNRRTAV